MTFKTSTEPEPSQTSSTRSMQNGFILRNLLGGVSERRVLREERQQRKNSKEGHSALISPYGVFLVGIAHSGLPFGEAKELLDELKELVQNLKWEKVGESVVSIREYRHEYLIGAGQAGRIIQEAKALGAKKIIIDHELSPAQQRHWEKLSGLSVIDRQQVILDIFFERAQTKEAVLQVELACMEYTLPRLKGAWTHLSRQRGGGSTQRGEGEKQLELDQRMVRERITKIKRELESVVQHRSVQRRQRLRIPLPTAAIVGYTNAGKSSLMNTLTQSHVLAEDKLFATLDPATRRWELPSGQVLLLTDTVGFIRNLPHHLIEAFKATLEESLYADYLFHVLDASHPSVLAQYETTVKVLEGLNLAEKRHFLIFNKIDLLKDPVQRALLEGRFPEAFFISVKTGEGLALMVSRVEGILKEATFLQVLYFNFTNYAAIQALRECGAIVKEKSTAEGVYILSQTPNRLKEKFLAFEHHGEVNWDGEVL
jgi:GTP-binding protein HflX